MPTNTLPSPTPTQAAALQQLQQAMRLGPLVRLTGHPGRGRTLLLQHLQAGRNAALLTWRDLLAEVDTRHPLALEEAFHRRVRDAMESHDTVLVDDMQVLSRVCVECHFYPRGGFLEAPALALAEAVVEYGKTLVLASSGNLPMAFQERSAGANLDRFTVADYHALCAHWLGVEEAGRIDFAKVHRFAPKLNGHQLRAACTWLQDTGGSGTDAFIDYLRSQRLASNVDLGEVAAVDLGELQGVDDVVRSLEIHVALPLENDALAESLALRPKRGVLLYGPPGTGKTTVGRALAHRLRGKFFLIDGTFIAGTSNFYERVHRVFEAAKENAPSVIFVDDADAIFEDGEERGLYRYLLTMLDGLESESAGRVCVMLTAMDVRHLPPALVRSGRVELWLEMRLPDAATRAAILERHLRHLPEPIRSANAMHIAAGTDGFTGADLKRAAEDAKALYAYDVATSAPVRDATDYVREAAEGVRRNKERYAEAEAAARERAAQRPSPSFGGFVHHMVTADME